MVKTKNTHLPLSKRQIKIAKVQQKLAVRLAQKNTDKKIRDIKKYEARIKKLATSQSLGTKGKLRQEIKRFDNKIATAGMWDSPTGPGRSYWEKKKAESLAKLRKIEAGQKKSQYLKKLLTKGFLPGQKKPGVKPTTSAQEKKRKHGYRQYLRSRHGKQETYLKSFYQEVFGKQAGKEKFSVALKRREKYKGKSGWFSKWVKKTESRLNRAEKSLQKSQQKKSLQKLGRMSKERVRKKPRNLSWNRWIETENKRLTTVVENKQKAEEEKQWQVIINKEVEKEAADTWSIYRIKVNDIEDVIE